MKLTNIILITLCSLHFSLNAQLKTFINVETGPSWNRVTASKDPGNFFSNAGLYGTFAGLTVEQELFENFSVGSGIYRQTFYDGIKMNDLRVGTASWNGFSAIQIPFHLKYRITFYDQPISITPAIGYVFGSITFPTDPYSASSILSDPEGIVLDYSLVQVFADDIFHSAEAGFSLDFRFPKNWQVGLNLYYTIGLSEPLVTELNYSDHNSESGTVSYNTNGDYMRLTMNLMLPLSNVWQERKQRLRNRIEKAYGGGKEVKEGMEIYFGGDIGALWRFFQYSNPAVAPRPLEGRGVFRYSNLKTGAYAGIMLNGYLGLDAGLYYQRSNTYFSIMYDHEVDLTINEHAPMFLEIPLKLRYYYNLVRGKLDLAVYAGGALLTSFTPAEYGSGDGSFNYVSPSTGVATDGSLNYAVSRNSAFGGAIKSGLGVEYRLPVKFPVITTLYADYSHGYIKLDETVITTSIPEEPAENNILYRGSGWSLSAGVKVPFYLDPKGTNRCGRLPRAR